jgi:hypothetical protein
MSAPESVVVQDQVAVGQPQVIKPHQGGKPTASHELADMDHGGEGSAQIEHEEIDGKGLGWNMDEESVPQPLIEDLSNEELWTLIRRFDKQIFHVKSIQHVQVGIVGQEKQLNAGKDTSCTDLSHIAGQSGPQHFRR